MNGESSPTQLGLIITGDVAPNPILDFEAYSNTIINMITQSHPKFSIGIYSQRTDISKKPFGPTVILVLK